MRRRTSRRRAPSVPIPPPIETVHQSTNFAPNNPQQDHHVSMPEHRYEAKFCLFSAFFGHFHRFSRIVQPRPNHAAFPSTQNGPFGSTSKTSKNRFYQKFYFYLSDRFQVPQLPSTKPTCVICILYPPLRQVLSIQYTVLIKAQNGLLDSVKIAIMVFSRNMAGLKKF